MAAAAADVVRRIYETWAASDVAAACDLYAKDAVFDWSRRQVEPLVAEGRSAVMRATKAILEPFAENRVEIEDLIEDDDRVIALIRARARGRMSGAVIDARVAHIWTVRDGLVHRMEYFGDREEALETLGAGK